MVQSFQVGVPLDHLFCRQAQLPLQLHADKVKKQLQRQLIAAAHEQGGGLPQRRLAGLPGSGLIRGRQAAG